MKPLYKCKQRPKKINTCEIETNLNCQKFRNSKLMSFPASKRFGEEPILIYSSVAQFENLFIQKKSASHREQFRGEAEIRYTHFVIVLDPP